MTNQTHESEVVTLSPAIYHYSPRTDEDVIYLGDRVMFIPKGVLHD